MKYIFVFTVVLAFMASSIIANVTCPDRPCNGFDCGDAEDLICATDGNGVYRTFNSACYLYEYNCRADTLVCFAFVNDGPCVNTSGEIA